MKFAFALVEPLVLGTLGWRSWRGYRCGQPSGDARSDEVRKLLKQMTLEEKANLFAGLDMWHLRGVERLQRGEVIATAGSPTTLGSITFKDSVVIPVLPAASVAV